MSLYSLFVIYLEPNYGEGNEDNGRGSGCSILGCDWVQQTPVWHKPSWRRWPLTPPESCQNVTQDWGNRLLEGTNRALCQPGHKRKEQWPHKRLTQTCLWVSGSLRRRCESAMAYCRVGGSECSSACMGPSEGGCRYLHYLHHSLPQVNNGEGMQPHPSTENWNILKIY